MSSIIYVDMDDVLAQYSDRYNKMITETPTLGYPQSQVGFFLGLLPVIGAIDSVNKLINNVRFDVYVLTAPSTKNPACYIEKRLWIEQYFGYEFTNKLIISPNKGLLKGDLLVDDQVSGRHQEDFEGELIHFGSKDYPDWRAVMARLFRPEQ